jgi:hypothetical protein
VDEAVLDVDALLPLRLVDVSLRVARVGGGELAGRPLERRREEQGLAIARHLRHDPVDRRLEADVEHAVGLVEDEDRDPLQIEGASLQLILEAARCGDHDVGVGGLLGLPVDADAAEDGSNLERAGVGDRAKLVDDLLGELAGRREDEGRRAARLGVDALDHRDAEGERLARPGRRLDEDVLTCEDVRDAKSLHRKRFFDAALGECAQDWARHAEIGE